MSMEWQVSNLELSKKLKELGVRQDRSLYYWHVDENGSFLDTSPVDQDLSKRIGGKENVSAFTVAELGIMQKNIHSFVIDSLLSEESLLFLESATEADARGFRLGVIIKNNILSLDEINKRLEEIKCHHAKILSQI